LCAVAQNWQQALEFTNGTATVAQRTFRQEPAVVIRTATALNQAWAVMLFLALVTEQSRGEEKVAPALTPKSVALETVAPIIVTPELAAPATLKQAALDAAVPKLDEPQMVKQKPAERVFAEQKTNKRTTPATGKKDALHSVLTANRSSSSQRNGA